MSDPEHVRATDPGQIDRSWAQRRRRLPTPDGRLLIVAADHPARGVLRVGANPQAMANRHDLVRRLVIALAQPGVDGVLGTADVLEDLLLHGALDDKLVIGSMNRGGLSGARFELDDRFTGYSAAAVQQRGLDGGKMLTRICLDDPGSAATLLASAQAVSELADLGLMAMIEPFVCVREGGHLRLALDPSNMITAVSVASGLGCTSAHTWLKLPVTESFATVMQASTLPTLLLGGDPGGDLLGTYARWESALELPGVRGLVVGRALLYPPDDDVAAAVASAAQLVHGTTPARSRG